MGAELLKSGLIWEPMQGKGVFSIGMLIVVGLTLAMIFNGYDVRLYLYLPIGLFCISVGIAYRGIRLPYPGAPDIRSKKQIKRCQ